MSSTTYLFNIENINEALVKETIKEVILNEDKNKPYSDQKLSSLLKERGIEISRRAVAKYREELGIMQTGIRGCMVLFALTAILWFGMI